MSSGGEDTWRSFRVPSGRELTESELSLLTQGVEDKVRELTGEDPDGTLVEYLRVMVANHASLSEVASELSEVADGDFPVPLCQWLHSYVEQAVLGGGNTKSQPRKPTTSAKTYIPLQGGELQEMYIRYLESGFQGDFAMYRATRDASAPQPKYEKKENDDEQTASSAAGTAARPTAQARLAKMTWSRFPEEQAKIEEKAQEKEHDPTLAVTDDIMGTKASSPSVWGTGVTKTISRGRFRGRGRGKFNVNQSWVRNDSSAPSKEQTLSASLPQTP